MAESQGLRRRLLVRLPEPGRDRLGELRAGDEGQGHQDPRVHRPARRTSSSSPTRWPIAGWHPDVILLSTNFYDELYRRAPPPTATSTSSRRSTRSRWPTRTRRRRTTWTSWSSTTPTARWPSSACRACRPGCCSPQAATACGSELTAECLLDEAAAPEEWTGGGLHARQTPGNGEPSPCFLLLGLDDDGFFYNEEATAPTDGPLQLRRGERLRADRRLQRYGAPPPEG